MIIWIWLSLVQFRSYQLPIIVMQSCVISINCVLCTVYEAYQNQIQMYLSNIFEFTKNYKQQWQSENSGIGNWLLDSNYYLKSPMNMRHSNCAV